MPSRGGGDTSHTGIESPVDTITYPSNGRAFQGSDVMSVGTSSHQINQGPLEDTGLTFNCPFHPQLALVLSLSSARATSKRIDTQSLP